MGKTVFIKDTAITGKDRTRDFYGVFLGILREKGLESEVQLVRVADIGVYGQGMVIPSSGMDAPSRRTRRSA